MQRLVVIVRKPREPEETLEIEDPRLLVGSGAHCDIRLPADAAYEHVLITQEEDQIVARPVLRELRMLVDGDRSTEAALRPGSVLTVESSSIEVVSVQKTSDEAGPAKPSPIRYVSIALATVACILGIFIAKNATSGGVATAPAPPDPAPLPKGGCPEKEPELARALAAQKVSQARDRRMRYRFYPGDGPEAAKLFATASTCFAAAGEGKDAADAQLMAEKMQSEVAEQFRIARVRLDRALTSGDAVQALQQIAFMRGLLGGREDASAYVAWLALLQSKVETALAKK